jgi:hypothetical protein
MPMMLQNGGWSAGWSIDATRLALLPVPSLSSYDANSFGAGLKISTRRELIGGTNEPLAELRSDSIGTETALA